MKPKTNKFMHIIYAIKCIYKHDKKKNCYDRLINVSIQRGEMVAVSLSIFGPLASLHASFVFSLPKGLDSSEHQQQ